ncbi:MAG: sulfite exporter TauE/SafE family protein [Cyclobacteriaceae bacterium]|nr:sulfite exporter TauE/SafE family protein [Cyclobacteriaceae bacterium]
MVAAFLMGFLGSAHCLGMCGPIAMLVEGNGQGIGKIKKRLLYNSGRIVTYATLGMISGSFGRVIFLSGFQQYFSMVIGIIMIITVSGYSFSKWVSLSFFSRGIFKIKNSLSAALRGKGIFNELMAGMLNGLLPCGLVYMAVVYSLTGSSPFEGMLLMILFGLGTVPTLFMTSSLASLLKGRVNMNKIVPVFISLLGVLLIIRGLGLGIPYVSPDIDLHRVHDETIICE